MDNFHILIIPIECIPSRIQLSINAKQEFKKYELALQQMFYEELQGSQPIFYERAIRTKNKDHMQQHVIPLSPHLIDDIHLMTIFHDMAKEFKLKFVEIPVSVLYLF